MLHSAGTNDLFWRIVFTCKNKPNDFWRPIWPYPGIFSKNTNHHIFWHYSFIHTYVIKDIYSSRAVFLWGFEPWLSNDSVLNLKNELYLQNRLSSCPKLQSLCKIDYHHHHALKCSAITKRNAHLCKGQCCVPVVNAEIGSIWKISQVAIYQRSANQVVFGYIFWSVLPECTKFPLQKCRVSASLYYWCMDLRAIDAAQFYFHWVLKGDYSFHGYCSLDIHCHFE